MPALACPGCRVSTDVPDERLSSRVYCSSCGGCLWVPPAASFVGEPPPIQRPLERSEPRIVYLDQETPAGRSTVGVLCGLLVLLGVALVAVVGLASSQSRKPAGPAVGTRSRASGFQSTSTAPAPEPITAPPAPPFVIPRVTEKPGPVGNVSAEREGRTWRLDDLCDYLERKKLSFTVADRIANANRPGVWLITPAIGRKPMQSVLVTQFADESAAAESHRIDPPKAPAKEKVWGRFVISGQDSEFFRRIVDLMR